MERNLLSRAAEFISEQRKKKRWTKVVTAMAAVVVFCTTYALILPAITQETDVFCGHEAHSHGADCYGQVLTCDLPEAKAHVHSDGCYEVERTLVCTQEESAGHTHSDACRTESSSLTCTSEEEGHEHGEGCYTVTSSVTCGQEESTGHSHGESCWEETRTLVCTESTELPEGGHVHGPDCYGGEELTCTKKEHEHELKCYSNPKADLESASVWERTLPDQLTGIWADDLLAVAETQLGYQESSRNYDVDNENNKLGYTRYGDWYGSPYGHWCAMFVSFCLHYADIPTQAFPWEASCQQWINDLYAEDLYRPAGDYTPKPGDLIFFNWDDEPDADHVGIVKEVTLDESGAVTQIKTIEGNTSNRVKIKTYLPTDESVMGYGELPENPDPPAESEEEGAEETEEPEETDEPDQTDEPETPDQTPEEPEVEEPKDSPFLDLEDIIDNAQLIDWDFIPDVSNGPVVIAYSFPIQPEEETEPEEEVQKPMRFMATRAAVRAGEETNLLDYIAQQNAKQPDPKKHASISFRLIDMSDPDNPKELSPDANGQYTVAPGEDYTFSIDLDLPGGIRPGTYSYRIPEGVEVRGGSGKITTKAGVELGDWSVDSSGNVILRISESADVQSQIKILAAVGIEFRETSEEVEFDGGIKVVVTKPPVEDEEHNTWYNKGAEELVDLDEDGDPEMVRWLVTVGGNQDSHIIGQRITDTLLQNNQTFDQKAKAEGIEISFYDATGTPHSWTIHAGASGLTWGESVWTYQLPSSIRCQTCNQNITLSNQYTYKFTYYSSITIDDVPNATAFGNRFEIQGDGNAEGWGQFYKDIGKASIIKNGDFNRETAQFDWTITLTLPGYVSGEVYEWSILDVTKVQYDWKDLDPVYPTPSYLLDGTIEATFTTTDGEFHRESVPNVDKADGTTKFAYYISKSGHDKGQVYMMSKCDCAEGKCFEWQNGACHGDYASNGYCPCWTVNHSTVFTFTYSNAYEDVVSNFGGLDGYRLNNTVHLYQDGNWFSYGGDNVDIPGVFDKKKWINAGIPENYKKYVASFEITVNEAMLDLSIGHDELTIVDTMSPTLNYISGSMVITARGTNGQTRTLTEGTDYMVSYNSSTHVITIVLKDPGQYLYTLRYDTEINITGLSNDEFNYSNTAEVTIFGKTYGDEVERVPITDIAATSTQYIVELTKVDANNNEVKVPGATLALYDKDGEQLFVGVTDENGKLDFVTSVTAGSLLYEHELYYIQEIAAPNGYKLDDSEHWFYFCNALNDGKTEPCDECRSNSIGSNVNAQRMPGDKIWVTVTNEPDTYVLPETGGAGTNGYTFGGLLLMAGAGFLLYRKTRDGREAKTSS